MAAFNSATNAWLSTLINKFALEEVRTKTWENPFARFKKGNMPLGYHAGFHHANPAALSDYVRPSAPNYTDPFAGADPVVFSDYLKVEADKIGSTIISDDYLSDAMTSWEKLDEFVQTIIGTLYTANAEWEYGAMISNLAYPWNSGNPTDMPYATIIDLAVPTNEATAQAAILSLAGESIDMERIGSGHIGSNSRSTVKTFTDKANQILISTDEFKLATEVYAKSVAFHVNYLDMLPEWLTVKSFGTYGAVVGGRKINAILIDEARFQWRDKLFRVESIRNPADGTTNYWLRRRALIGNVNFANGQAFVEPAGE